MWLWTNTFLLSRQKQGAGRERTTGTEQKNSERVLIVVSLIPALFTLTDSLSGQALLVYTDPSENILHAFSQHNCCWVVLTPWSLCLVQPFQVHREERAAAQPGRMGRQLVVLLQAGTHWEELQGLICTPPEAGPSFFWKVMTFHIGSFSFGVFWATTSTWFVLRSASCPSHDQKTFLSCSLLIFRCKLCYWQ